MCLPPSFQALICCIDGKSEGHYSQGILGISCVSRDPPSGLPHSRHQGQSCWMLASHDLGPVQDTRVQTKSHPDCAHSTVTLSEENAGIELGKSSLSDPRGKSYQFLLGEAKGLTEAVKDIWAGKTFPEVRTAHAKAEREGVRGHFLRLFSVTVNKVGCWVQKWQ